MACLLEWGIGLVLEFLNRQPVKQKMICQDDIDIMYFTQDPEDAVKHIVDFYKMYHSMRYIRDLLVLRIEEPLTDAQLDQLNEEFKHLLKKGKIAQSLKPFEEEGNVPYTFDLTRLAFHFNKDSFVELKKMIHRINEFAPK